MAMGSFYLLIGKAIGNNSSRHDTIKQTTITGRIMNNFVFKTRMAKDGPWELTSNKGEKYIFGLYFGKVKRDNNEGFLIIFGPLYFIFGWKK